ncbi:HET-domain-containing protein [Karstenula rhodostoma CBS 690.94]|uniref:HET-domain-containing protein n=1 Tax=Karstenula rhodostoma CBS 690.94 TaxID=1392251 RepID=A0A9P4PMI1_9PLEO|nr:HET-domain-containing protein [Karstenula rhodostoma CBS 690.94]
MEFCTNCQTIVNTLFIKSRYQSLEFPSCDAPSSQLVQRFQLGTDYRELYSIDEDCKLCSFIKQGLPSEDVARRASETWPVESRSISIQAKGGNAFRHASDDSGLQIFQMQIALTAQLGLLQEFSLDFSVTAAVGSLAATSGDVFGTKPLLEAPASDTLSKLTGWFNECASGHEKCRQYNDTGTTAATKPKLPTRILDIRFHQDVAVVCLIESHGLRADYATLSYRWGPPEKQPLRTTKGTLSQHLAGIQLSQLPRTFQDAVSIARAVNLQYLWIDSLCIIQDDLDDWNTEAPSMGQIYSDAALVIAASGACDSSEGCFLTRISPEPFIEIPYVREDGVSHGHIQLSTKRHTVRLMPVREPLGERGWVLQEWALARRLVHFTNKGMMWSCRVLDGWAMCEDGHLVMGTAARDWDDIIDEYTLRKLTYLSDKLAAVEGIARIMKRGRKDQYVSGVWTGEMPQQLFWVASRTTRPQELWCFPSWSWASTQGPCVMLVPKRVPRDRITIRSTVEAKDPSTLVVNCQVSKIVMKKDKLTLREATQLPLFAGLTTPNSIPSLQYLLIGGVAHHLLDPETLRVVGLVVLDDDEDLEEDRHVYTSLLLMKEVCNSPTRGLVPIFLALLVREAHGPVQAYQRIGAAFIVDEEMFQTVDKENFTLI